MVPPTLLKTVITSPNLPPPLPPELGEPTEQEKSLISLYETVRLYEREASKIKERAAKARLEAAHAKYEREQGKGGGDVDDDDDDMNDKKNGDTNDGADDTTDNKKKLNLKPRRKKRQKSSIDGVTDVDLGDEGESYFNVSSSEDDEGHDDDNQEEASEVAKMRSRLDNARKRKLDQEAAAVAAREEEEKLRMELLAEPDGDNVVGEGVSLQRKQRGGDDEDEDRYGEGGDSKKSSLLLGRHKKQATPPHEFSRRLQMGRANLSGRVLFPIPLDGQPPKPEDAWVPPESATGPSDGCLELQLEDFDPAQASVGSGNNTIAIKFIAPFDSKRFSLNIAGPNHRDYDDIMFHFNPRKRQKGGQLVINDKKDGYWGQALNVPLSQIPNMFGRRSSTLILQINGDGYDVFVNGKHCARLEHRIQLPSMPCSLTLQFPSTDDYGSRENWTVYKVWWGHKAIMAGGDLSKVSGAKAPNTLHPRKLFVSALPKVHNDSEADARRSEIERAFSKYGGSHGVTVSVPPNSTFAFVQCETERQADLALHEMSDQYKLSRARKTKHEMLQEERALVEKKKKKAEMESEWD